MATTVYDITTDFSDQDIYTDVLLADSIAASVPITDVSCRSQSNPNKVLFESATPLSAPDKTTLDGVVAAYDPADGIHGDFPDDQFRIQDNEDITKEMAFEISGVSTGTVRTLTMPDASITPDDSSASRPPDAHAASHSDGGSDEVTIENLATAGTSGQVPTSDGAGGLTMATPSGSGNVTSPGGETAARITKFTSPNNIDETAVTETQLDTLVGGGIADSEHTHADFDDITFRIQDSADITKEIAFQASTITTGTVRTITMPDKNVLLDDAGDSRTPTAHAASHSDAGSDEITVEDLATSGGSGSVPTSDGAGNLTMSIPAGGGNVTSPGFEVSGRIAKFTGTQNIDETAITETQLTTLTDTSNADTLHTHADFDDSTFRVQDNTDPTKEIAFQASGITTATVRTITVPDADITIDDVGNTRTPAAHTIASHSDTTATGAQLNTLVGGGIADVEHTHADFADDTFRIQDNADPTKELAFQVSGVTTGTVRTVTVPDASITVDDVSASRPPNGSATGDLSGSYPAPTVEGLSGRAISGTTPTEGQLLTLVSSVWTPTSPGSGTDGDAIHDNVAAEISAIAEKTTPVSADLIIIEDSAASNAKKRVQIGNLPGGGGSSFPIYKLPAVDLEGSLDSSSDWFLNVLAPLDADPDNDAIKVRSHDNAVDEAWGYTIAVPATATNMTIKIRSRPFSAPAGAVTLIPLIYFREEPDAAAVGTWSQGLSASAMDTINFPITDTFYVYSSQTQTLAEWGVTASSDWRFQIFNDNSVSTLASFWLVRYVEVSFS